MEKSVLWVQNHPGGWEKLMEACDTGGMCRGRNKVEQLMWSAPYTEPGWWIEDSRRERLELNFFFFSILSTLHMYSKFRKMEQCTNLHTKVLCILWEVQTPVIIEIILCLSSSCPYCVTAPGICKLSFLWITEKPPFQKKALTTFLWCC